MSIAIVLGTSRKNGNTSALVNEFANITGATIFPLSDFSILPFDYEFKNKSDDFSSLINQVIEHDIIMFASPVYWYSPSAQMKIFMDRLSDLLKINKSIGRQLRGRVAGVISTGSDQYPKDCFEQIFCCTFDYLGLDYLGMLYCDCDDDFSKEKHKSKIINFCARNEYFKDDDGT